MVVYFQGSEREDFVLSNQNAVQTAGADTSNSRVSLRVAGYMNNYMESTTFSTTQCWTHYTVTRDAPQTGTGEGTELCALWYSGSTPIIALHYNNTYIAMKWWNGSSWVIMGTSGSFDVYRNWTTMDVFLKIGASGTGEARLYCNRTPAINNNTTDFSLGGTITNVTNVRWTPGSNSGGSSGQSYHTEFIIADFNTIGAKVITLTPNGSGTYNAWTGAGYTSVDETSPTADFMTSNTINQRFSVNFSDLSALNAGESIASVKVGGAFVKDLAGPQSLNFFTRISATDYDGTDQTVPLATNANSSISQAWANNPSTSGAWTVSDVNSAEFGVRSRT